MQLRIGTMLNLLGGEFNDTLTSNICKSAAKMPCIHKLCCWKIKPRSQQVWHWEIWWCEYKLNLSVLECIKIKTVSASAIFLVPHASFMPFSLHPPDALRLISFQFLPLPSPLQTPVCNQLITSPICSHVSTSLISYTPISVLFLCQFVCFVMCQLCSHIPVFRCYLRLPTYLSCLPTCQLFLVIKPLISSCHLHCLHLGPIPHFLNCDIISWWLVT